MNAALRLLRHLWLDADDAVRAIGAEALLRLESRVQASEQRHTGEICLCVEASLPTSYLWRHLWRRAPIDEVIRERALSLFGKLRVWDTELNNGVLIYLQLAEHHIEIVADRAVARRVPDSEWDAVVAGMGEDFRAGHYEDGLGRAVDAVGVALERHFPRPPAAEGEAAARANQLGNRPIVR